MNGNMDSLFRLPEDSVCLGTKPVKVRRTDGDSSSTVAGMVAAFECREQSSQSHLLVLVTDGSSTFQGRIHPEQTKCQWERHISPDETKPTTDDVVRVNILSSFLLKDSDEHVVVSYDFTQDGQVKLVLREKLSTGLVRILWPGTLERVGTDGGALSFCSALGTCVNAATLRIQQLEKERETLKTDLSGWKDTAEKLDGQWQNEKDALLERFLALYKTAHEELGKSHREVQRLKKQASDAAQKLGSKKKAPPAPTFDEPDDYDVKLYSEEMVERLAGGSASNSAPVEKRATSNSSTTAIGARANPHTGALEVWDTDALLQDPEFLGISTEVGDANEQTKRKSPDANPSSTDPPVAKKLKY